MARRISGHALLRPGDGEPYRCRCGVQFDWPRSENYPGGCSRFEARDIYRFHLHDVEYRAWQRSMEAPTVYSA